MKRNLKKFWNFIQENDIKSAVIASSLIGLGFGIASLITFFSNETGAISPSRMFDMIFGSVLVGGGVFGIMFVGFASIFEKKVG